MSMLLSSQTSSSSFKVLTSTTTAWKNLFGKSRPVLHKRCGNIFHRQQQQFSSPSGKRWQRIHQQSSHRRRGGGGQTNQNQIGFAVIGTVATVAGAASAYAMAFCEGKQGETKSVQPQWCMEIARNEDNDDFEDTSNVLATASSSKTSLRSQSFPLAAHSHGKARVRVLKVVKLRSPIKGEPARHVVQEYNVATTLFSDDYERCYTNDDNTDLVATDTQKNTVYYVAKVCHFDSPEGFGALLCHHFLKEYPMLQKVQVDIDQVVWDRASVSVDGTGGENSAAVQDHNHAFVKRGPESYGATVTWERPTKDTAKNAVVGPKITSKINKLTVLKTTQSGFEGYLQDDYTLLPPTKERCLATELDATWTYRRQNPATEDDENYYQVNHVKTRSKVLELLFKTIFGPPDTGVYSPSLQATIYDAACVILTHIPEIESITIHTPNLHYLPCKLLDSIGDAFEDDIFIPTSEPSGIITCTVVRGQSVKS